MSKFTTEQVRSTFIDYFVKNDHTFVSSSPLIPHNDPSLMFVNSGMVQFKNVFTGHDERDYKRAVSSQKSVRAGGKHNDLDNVGYTARHHTFFEMLGNFSFGDYFKEQAIYYAWNLLTKEFQLPKEKLYVTVYHTDDEAAAYWKKIAGFGDDRIIRITTNDNFWSMGDTGPCGPCSEIFYDHGPHIPGGLPGTPQQDGDRFIEIWNMVFMQFEQIDKDTRIDLPQKSIDTGMGLERIAATLQGVHDNYDIDLFKELIGYAESLLKVQATGEAKFSYRVIADHLRSCSFLIADGVMPSNEGRGYVLRRIMRRAMRHAHQLGSKEPLMYRLLPKLVELMASAYPEIRRAELAISDVLKQEEVRFKTTLDRGLKLLDEETFKLAKGAMLSGEVAFKLYDTYGFPLDLTEDILKNKHLQVDLEGFNKNMEEQKERARKSWTGSGEAKADNIWFDLKAEFGATEFVGYSLNTIEGKVIALIKDGVRVEKVTASDLANGGRFTIITNQTPFYGESGGQMGDVGAITTASSKIKVVDTIKCLGSIHAHICEFADDGKENKQVSVSENVTLAIDVAYRRNLRSHHSATHILHAVLREVLGKHITQKGSLVAHDRLRFDISHPNALSKKEITLIENKVNNIILDNSQVNTVLMSTEEAIEAGAMALFGEKYDMEVRVVSMGAAIDAPYSLELCGGTHVARTGDIGLFKITGESAIAAGVRRIEAVCSEAALKLVQANEALLLELSEVLKSTKTELVEKVNNLLSSKKELEKEVSNLKIGELTLSSEQLAATAKTIGNIRLVYKLVQDVDPKILRAAAEQNVRDYDDVVLVYISNIADKLSIAAAVSKAASDKCNAGAIAKALSIFLGGNGGGGQATLAQAGGSDKDKLAEVEEYLKNLLRAI